VIASSQQLTAVAAAATAASADATSAK